MNYTEHEEYPKNFIDSIPDVLLIGLGGSHAYGTNTETSDLDIRGIYRNPIDELYGIKPDSEQYVDNESDTTIYSMKKMFHLLSNCNPNTIELLGLKDNHYLVLTDEAKIILDQKEIFLSKKAIYTFGQYAASQLNRLINKSGRGKSMMLENEQRSLSKSMTAMEERYHKGVTTVKFDIIEPTIYVDLSINHMDINDVSSILNQINTVHRDYTKSKRNDKAIEHNKLNKHMMHLLRLYMMGIDILESHEIITYREKEHDLLMSIRNSEYLEDDGMTPTKEFMSILNDYTERFNEASKSTTLPDNPDFEKINKLSIRINQMRN